jgi:hypothetical protein
MKSFSGLEAKSENEA